MLQVKITIVDEFCYILALKETAQSIQSVEIITTEGQFRTLNKSELSFGYRYSSFRDMEDLAAITAVTFGLERSNSARKRQHEYLER